MCVPSATKKLGCERLEFRVQLMQLICTEEIPTEMKSNYCGIPVLVVCTAAFHPILLPGMNE